MASITVSVIVPIFNTPLDLLHKCIDSILRQSYPNFELLLIDDGSTVKDVIDTCDEYSCKDQRVRVYHTRNNGLGGARNFGISKASCDWLCFVDSDDWCEETYLEDFISDGIDKIDLVVQGVIQESKGRELGRRAITSGIYKEDEVLSFFYNNDLINFSSAWAKLFNRDIIIKHNLLYPTLFSYGEDSAFFPKYFRYCRAVKGVSKENYHYVYHSDETLSRKVHDTELLFYFVKDCRESILALKRNQYGELIARSNNRKSVALAMRGYLNMYKLHYDTTRKQECIESFRKDIRPLLNGKNLPLKEHLFYLFTRLPVKAQIALLDIYLK